MGVENLTTQLAHTIRHGIHVEFTPRKKAMVLFSLFYLIVPFLSAGTIGNPNTEYDVSARGLSMGAAYTALSQDSSAVFWNPAGLGFSKNEFSLSHSAYLDDTSSNVSAIALPLSAKWSVGGGINYFDLGKVEGSDINGQSIEEPRSHDANVALAAARRFDRLSIGVTFKIIESKLANEKVFRKAADIGSLLSMTNQTYLGFAIANLEPSFNSGSSNSQPPLIARTAIAIRLVPQLLTTMENRWSSGKASTFHFGTEYRFDELISVRVGYDSSERKKIGTMTGIRSGIGLILKRLKIDYAWAPYGELGDVHTLSISMNIDSQRE